MQNAIYKFVKPLRSSILNNPYRTINFSDPADVVRHDCSDNPVDTMLSLHKQSAACLPNEKERLQRLIQTTDRQIDKLVYELYDLTDEAIKIVEETK